MSRLTLSFKGLQLREIVLGEGTLTVGSDPGCDIHIDSLALQPQHASITVADGKALVRDLGTPDGTFVNHQRISDETVLTDGDEIDIGKHTLSYTQATVPTEQVPETTEPAAEKEPDSGTKTEEEEELVLHPASRPKNAWLQILNGQNLGKTINLKRRMTHLGKSGVQMAVIAHRNDGFFLSHLEGKLPTLVGGTDIADRSQPLKDGDIIQIGNIKMQFYLQ